MVTIECDLGEMPPVLCRAAQLNQVFMSLLIYVADGIDDDGVVRIASRARDQAVEVRISADGLVIPPADLDHVFDPGFTTDRDRIVMELGLPLAYRIVEDHRGTLTATSVPGAGTSFNVVLPLGH